LLFLDLILLNDYLKEVRLISCNLCQQKTFLWNFPFITQTSTFDKITSVFFTYETLFAFFQNKSTKPMFLCCENSCSFYWIGPQISCFQACLSHCHLAASNKFSSFSRNSREGETSWWKTPIWKELLQTLSQFKLFRRCHYEGWLRHFSSRPSRTSLSPAQPNRVTWRALMLETGPLENVFWHR